MGSLTKRKNKIKNKWKSFKESKQVYLKMKTKEISLTKEQLDEMLKSKAFVGMNVIVNMGTLLLIAYSRGAFKDDEVDIAENVYSILCGITNYAKNTVVEKSAIADKND